MSQIDVFKNYQYLDRGKKNTKHKTQILKKQQHKNVNMIVQ